LVSRPILYLPEFDITDEHCVSRCYCDDESSQAIQKTQFQEIDFQKFEERAKKKQQETKTFPFFIHVFSDEARKIVHCLELP
jgi:hypothetical protein